MMSAEEIAALKKMARDNGILLLDESEEILEALNSQRPKIRLPGENRELGQFAREVGELLAKKDLFRRDVTPVIVNQEKGRLDVMTPEMLRTWAELHLVCFKDKQIGQGKDAHVINIVKTMNVDTARGTLASWQLLNLLPEIERVNPTRLPMITASGSIELLAHGYSQEQRVYTLDDGLTYDEEMTPEDARIYIEDLLREFPFRDARSKAVQIASMLTMFCASMLPRRSLRPGFICTANSTGAGKTLLTKFAIIPVAGTAAPRGFPRKEELRKVLDLLAMDATTYILFDNIRGSLGGEEIEAFITAPEWEGRVLGESTKFRVENVATCFFTGNDSRPSPDMSQRCLFVELFVEEADSRDRPIARVIDDAFLSTDEVRGKVCSAMWTMVKAWDAAGRPGPITLMPRFEAWSRIVAAIVAHAGFGDPCEKPDIASARGEITEMRALVLKLAPEPPADREEWTFAEIMGVIRDNALFEDEEMPRRKGEEAGELFSEEGELSPAGKSHFGKMLRRFDGRLFAGEKRERLRFSVVGKKDSRKYIVVNEPLEGPAASPA